MRRLFLTALPCPACLSSSGFRITASNAGDMVVSSFVC